MSIFNLKKDWDDKVPQFQHKVSKMLDSGDTQASGVVNPFLNKNGELFNPFMNYQQVLDNPSTSDKVKNFIQNATGLTPTARKITKAVTPSGGIRLSAKSTDGPIVPDSSASVPASDSSIVNAAKSYIGTPYVWGGESMAEGGMDCSGFVYNALKDAGYNVGRTTAQGYRNSGTHIDKSNMQPGDLVFFGKNGNASHIGIYIGNGQMVHSSGGSKNTKSNPGKGVSVTNVDYRSDFLEARRY